MTCSDCAPLSIRAESLQRRLEAAEMDLREAGKERAGLLAEIARLRGQVSGLASQITGGV